jgi:TP901 family phage tail tape measure protein
MKGYTVPTVYTAVDKATSVVNKMADNAATKAARMERSFRKVGDAAQNVAKKTAMMGLAILAPIALLANEAIKFEDKMADVAKVANVAIGSETFTILGDKAKDLGIFLGVGATEAAGLMQNLAQGGVAIKDLDEVSRIAGKVGVAFGISADEAGAAFIKTRNALGGTIESTALLMDSINMLGNTTAASSAQIVTFMSNGGSAVARAMGASGEAVAGMAAQLISMGTSAEESATVMTRFTKTVMSNKDLRAVFDKAGGGAEGMMAVIQKGAKLSGKAQDAYFQKFGAYGLKLQLLAKNFDQLQGTVNAATDATATADSVNKEFANRTATTGFKLEQAKARFGVLAIEIGSVLLPAINKIIERLTPLIERFTKWARENKGTITTIVKVAAVIGGLLMAISAISFAVAAFTKIVMIVKGVMFAWKAITVIFTAAQWLLNAALTANPIGLIIVAIAALIAIVALVISKYEKWGAAATFLLGPLGMVINLVMAFRRNWDGITDAFSQGGILAGIKKIGAVLLDSILMPMQQLLKLLTGLPGAMGRMAQSGVDGIEKLRTNLGVEVGATVNGGKPLTPINPEMNRNEMLKETIQTNNANVSLNINDPKNRVNAESDSPFVRIMTTSTLATQ